MEDAEGSGDGVGVGVGVGAVVPTSAPSAAGREAETSLRKTEPGVKRLFITLSVLISFLLSIPLLYKSTEIHRSPLPTAAIATLSTGLGSDPPSYHFNFQVVFLLPAGSGGGPEVSHLGSLISSEVRRLAPDSAKFTVSATIDTEIGCYWSGGSSIGCLWGCGAASRAELIGRAGDDAAVDELLHTALNSGSGDCVAGSMYSVVVVGTEEGDEGKGVRVVIGKHRHAWIVGRIDDTISTVVGEVLVKYFINGGAEDGEGSVGKAEFMPIGSDGNVVLSFSLLNADPRSWSYDWQFETVGVKMLEPVVEALAPVANISIESQVLYHSPKSAHSYWDESLGGNILTIGDLPFFVNSNEWHLDTSIFATGRSKILQFVVYVPSSLECPLYVQLLNGQMSKTNAFISPMWGGIIIWNPPSCSIDYQDKEVTRRNLPNQELHEIIEIFIGQLRLLFGFNSTYLSNAEDVYKLVASEKGFAEWELDLLYRRHSHSNLLSCLTTLQSLSTLVELLPRMIVMDEIGKQVELSVETAYLARGNASLGISNASALSALRARALAEDAFFHPSLMSISYSSMEHYVAIYMPFFAPVCLHVLVAATKEVKRWRVERSKYRTFLGGRSTASS